MITAVVPGGGARWVDSSVVTDWIEEEIRRQNEAEAARPAREAAAAAAAAAEAARIEAWEAAWRQRREDGVPPASAGFSPEFCEACETFVARYGVSLPRPQVRRRWWKRPPATARPPEGWVTVVAKQIPRMPEETTKMFTPGVDVRPLLQVHTKTGNVRGGVTRWNKDERLAAEQTAVKEMATLIRHQRSQG